MPARNYTWDRFVKDSTLVETAIRKAVRVDDRFADIPTKRALLRKRYPKLTGNSGEPVAVEDCKPERIGSAFKRIFDAAVKNVEAYRLTLDYYINLEREQRRQGIVDPDVGERIATMLDRCSAEELAKIAAKYGKGVLGGYAESASVPSACEGGTYGSL
ncbi:MAG: hypothetical protein QW548_01205 [Candidatus Aenigmatarchaeota archaeon]